MDTAERDPANVTVQPDATKHADNFKENLHYVSMHKTVTLSGHFVKTRLASTVFKAANESGKFVNALLSMDVSKDPIAGFAREGKEKRE